MARTRGGRGGRGGRGRRGGRGGGKRGRAPEPAPAGGKRPRTQPVDEFELMERQEVKSDGYVPLPVATGSFIFDFNPEEGYAYGNYIRSGTDSVIIWNRFLDAYSYMSSHPGKTFLESYRESNGIADDGVRWASGRDTHEASHLPGRRAGERGDSGMTIMSHRPRAGPLLDVGLGEDPAYAVRDLGMAGGEDEEDDSDDDRPLVFPRMSGVAAAAAAEDSDDEPLEFVRRAEEKLDEKEREVKEDAMDRRIRERREFKAAFPSDIDLGKSSFGRRPLKLNVHWGHENDVSPFSARLIQLAKTSKRRFPRLNEFSLRVHAYIAYRVTLGAPLDMQWVTMDFGQFEMTDMFGRNRYRTIAHINQAVWNYLEGWSDNYGEEFWFYGFTAHAVDLSYSAPRGGACKSTNAKLKVNGHLLQSFKGPEGTCGMKCLHAGIKSNRARLSVDPSFFDFRNFNNLCINYLQSNNLPFQGMFWNCDELAAFPSSLNINVVFYDVSRLDDEPIFGKERLDALFTVRIAWCAPESVFADGQHGHFLLIRSLTKICPKCGDESFVVGRHTCSTVCSFCSKKYRASNNKHRCKEMVCSENELLMSVVTAEEEKKVVEEDVDDLRFQRIKQVDAIVNNEVNDDDTLTAWRSAFELNHPTALLGYAGTGKTYQCVKLIADLIESKYFEPHEIGVVCSEACGTQQYHQLRNKGVDVSTIHSFLSLTPTMKPEKRLGQMMGEHLKYKAQLDRIKCKQLILIDEVGNTHPELFGAMNLFLQAVNRNNAPMGGCRLILTGDFRQRPPVAKVRKDPLFMCDLWQQLGVKCFVLKQQRRLAGTSPNNLLLLRAQLEVASGVLQENTRQALNTLCIRPSNEHYLDPEVTFLVNTNKQVFEVGLLQLHRFYTPDLIRSYPEVLRASSTDRQRKHTVKYDSLLELAVGCPFMFTTNDHIKKGATNGTMATVISMSEDAFSVCLQHDESVVIEVKRINMGEGRKQFPGRLAYARTTHKSQGATLARVCFTPPKETTNTSSSVALAYVALTRVRDVAHLTLTSPLLDTHIVVDSMALLFMDLCEKEYSFVRHELEQHRRSTPNQYLLNFQLYRQTLTAPSKAIHTKPHTFAKRGVERGQYPFRLWNDIVTYDLETAPDYDKNPDFPPERPYSCFANWWVDEGKDPQPRVKASFEKGILEGGGLECENVMDDFMDWLMNLIVLPKCQRWVDSSFKSHKGPIILIGFNGSGFDFSFLMNSLLHRNSYGLEITPHAIRGSKVYSCDFIYTHGVETKVALKLWDPYLISMSSLNDGHKSFCPEQHKLLRKDVFPHLFTKRVGAIKAFEHNQETKLNIDEDFPASMRKDVKAAIREGRFRSGGDNNHVMFNLVTEHRQYLRKDVEMMENLIDSLQDISWNRLAVGENVPIHSFVTMASYSYWLSIRNINPLAKKQSVGDDKNSVHTDIHRMSARLVGFVRKTVYGGRTLPRCRLYRSSVYNEVKAARKEDAYVLAAKDCLYYLDINGMYHSIMKDGLFPYGPHIELVSPEDCKGLLEGLLAGDYELRSDFPMFLARVDIEMNKHDLESSIPQRGEGGRLLWNNLDKKQQYYNSEHLLLALRSGHRITNMTWGLVWGKRSKDGVWTGKKCKLFEDVMEKYEELRLEGGAVKKFGKGAANTTYGAHTKRDFHTDYKTFIRENEGEICPDHAEYVRMFSDSNRKCTYHEVSEGTASNPHRVVVSTRWEVKIEEEKHMASRASWIGSFVLAYSHQRLEALINSALGMDRYMDDYRCQIVNGDTDSLILHISRVTKDSIPLDWTKLGSMSDDLEGSYEPDKNKPVEFDENGHPIFARIILQVSPSKKNYAMEIVTPAGDIIEIDPKSKGLPKGKVLALMTGKRFDEMKRKINFDPKLIMSACAETRSNERLRLMNEMQEKYSFTDSLSIHDLVNVIENPDDGGIVGAFRTWKNHGFCVSAARLAEYVEFFQKENTTMVRHLYSGGVSLPPERRLLTDAESAPFESKEDRNLWSVPDGWLPSSENCPCWMCAPAKPAIVEPQQPLQVPMDVQELLQELPQEPMEVSDIIYEDSLLVDGGGGDDYDDVFDDEEDQMAPIVLPAGF